MSWPCSSPLVSACRLMACPVKHIDDTWGGVVVVWYTDEPEAPV